MHAYVQQTNEKLHHGHHKLTSANIEHHMNQRTTLRSFILTINSDDLPDPVEEAPVLRVGGRLVMDEFHLTTAHNVIIKLFRHCRRFIITNTKRYGP